ncbi:MAG: leucine-rich repeat domain-containing protein [Spirochaetaceae bacterium]|nr:leucine-rich repeat domain-containing protein [Spirochaetaceae bacterium]
MIGGGTISLVSMVSAARRLLGPLVVLGLTLGLAGCGSDDDKDGGVNIPDDALERVVRQAIGKFEGPITAADLEGITSLTTSSLGTMDLTGLEHATNLATLEFHHTQIDLSFLTRFPKLTRLRIEESRLSDIAPLAALTGLTHLNLKRNEIGDISALASLTNLTTLNLRWNLISDISPLAGLTSLTELDLGRNEISDISPLAALTNLTELMLLQNQITDVSPLLENTGLSEGDSINLAQNQFDEEAAGAAIKQLEERGVKVEFVRQHQY